MWCYSPDAPPRRLGLLASENSRDLDLVLLYPSHGEYKLFLAARPSRKIEVLSISGFPLRLYHNTDFSPPLSDVRLRHGSATGRWLTLASRSIAGLRYSSGFWLS